MHCLRSAHFGYGQLTRGLTSDAPARHLKVCRPFLWGGCKGNVPFGTKKSCRHARCDVRCTQEPDSGPCRAAVSRWFFDNNAGVRVQPSLSHYYVEPLYLPHSETCLTISSSVSALFARGWVSRNARSSCGEGVVDLFHSRLENSAGTRGVFL